MMRMIWNMVRVASVWLGGTAVLVLLIAWQAGVFYPKFGTDAVAAPEQPVVAAGRIVEVVRQQQRQLARIPGTVAARHEVMVSARVMATVEQMTVDAGDSVEQGQVLVQLDSRDLQARLRQAQSGLVAAQSQAELARTQYQRALQLYQQNVSPRSEFDRAAAEIAVASAEVERLRRAVDEAQVGLSYTRITAPMSGRIVDRLVDPGDTISPGQPLLKLYDPQQLQLEAYVRESLALGLVRGTTLEVGIDALAGPVTGTVAEIVPQADPGARAMLVKVALAGDEQLYPGLFGRLRIPLGMAELIVVPAAAVRRVGQLTQVQMVGADGHVTGWRMVRLGPKVGEGKVQVLAGLTVGERVVMQ